jgi:hypothetical protein
MVFESEPEYDQDSKGLHKEQNSNKIVCQIIIEM